METEMVDVVHTPKRKIVRHYGIAFALVKHGQRFFYRSVQAVKTGKNEAVLIPSGKFVKIELSKMVRVRV